MVGVVVAVIISKMRRRRAAWRAIAAERDRAQAPAQAQAQGKRMRHELVVAARLRDCAAECKYHIAPRSADLDTEFHCAAAPMRSELPSHVLHHSHAHQQEWDLSMPHSPEMSPAAARKAAAPEAGCFLLAPSNGRERRDVRTETECAPKQEQRGDRRSVGQTRAPRRRRRRRRHHVLRMMRD